MPGRLFSNRCVWQLVLEVKKQGDGCWGVTRMGGVFVGISADKWKRQRSPGVPPGIWSLNSTCIIYTHKQTRKQTHVQCIRTHTYTHTLSHTHACMQASIHADIQTFHMSAQFINERGSKQERHRQPLELMPMSPMFRTTKITLQVEVIPSVIAPKQDVFTSRSG